MRFAMSYSCGKDSTLALDYMLNAGHEPICLITTLKKDEQRSWFHGVDLKMLKAYEKSLGIPLLVCESSSENYADSFEKVLHKASKMGAQSVAFGDLDIELNRKWEEDRANACGLEPIFPLWDRDRNSIVREILQKNYKCIIKCVDTSIIPARFAGKILDEVILKELIDCGSDPCGENGEYHTLAIDGPIFKMPLNFEQGKVVNLGNHAFIELKNKMNS